MPSGFLRSLAVSICAMMIGACGSGAGSTTTPAAPPPPTAPPVATSFVAIPAVISLGEASTLSWAVTGADYVVISPGAGAASGASTTVRPSSSTTYTLIAVNHAGASTATATVTVTPVVAPVSVTVTASPQTTTMVMGATRAFTALVTGSADTAVTWSVVEGPAGGAVDATGSYTAPAGVGSFHLRATSKADPAKSDGAVVTVVAYLTPGTVTGDVTISMDSRTAKPISPYIYGVNFAELGGTNPISLWGTYLPRFTLNRFGGNRATSFSWATGYSNCGSDCRIGVPPYTPTFPNDNNLLANVFTGPGVGAALQPRIDTSFAANASILLTTPIIGYVAKDASGNQPVPVAPSGTLPGTPDPAHWLQALPSNPTGPTAFPSTAGGFVYTDDYVKWVDTNYPAARSDPVKGVQYELDNEPDIWSGTHAEIRGQFAGGPNGGQIPTGFDELVSKSLAHAKAIKRVVPGATVWGGAFAGFDGLTHLNFNAHPGGPPPGYVYYLDYFLEKLKAAETNPSYLGRMVDVIDMHWYVQDGSVVNDSLLPQDATVIDAREQSPRSLWDPTYIENSWVPSAVPSLDRASGCVAGNCPLRILSRVQERIAKFYPGTKLAVGEYWYGRGGDISAAIANADVLGIFGRLGVYAANMWPNASNIWAYNAGNNCNNAESCAMTHAYSCALKAIDIYRSYDGAGARFGDTSIASKVLDSTFTKPATQNERVTAYASMDAGAPNRVVIVAINKSQTASLNTGLSITHNADFGRAEVYQITGINGGGGGCTGPVREPDVAITSTNAFNASLPAQSVTVFVLKP